jgi:DNA (cytosine-5)-methyltransferase 1
MPTITTAKGGAIGVAKPFLVKLRGTNDAATLDSPAPTITAGGTHLGLAEPFLIHAAHAGERRARSVDEPLPTIAGNRGDMALCQAALLPQQGGGVLRPVSEPAPTVATDGAIALVEPYLVKYHGTGGARAVTAPLDTVTTRDRFGLVRPVVVVDGERYLLDIRFRMLQPHELAAAQGFRRDYKFSGNKSEQVKQIGNAVPRGLARALVLAALTQRSDVRELIRQCDAAA